MDSFLRPMSTAEILDRTFNLYRNNFLLFAGITIFPALLGLILQLAGIAANINGGSSPDLEKQLAFLGYELGVFCVMSVIGGGIATGATVTAVYGVQLGQSPTIAGSYRQVLAQWLRVMPAAFLLFLLIMFSLLVVAVGLTAAVFWLLTEERAGGIATIASVIAIVLVIAGFWLYLTARYSLVMPSLLLDNTTVFGAFRRSRFLAKGTTGRIFLILLLTGILTAILSWALQLPVLLVMKVQRHLLLVRVWSQVVQFISSILAGPIATIAVALTYIDQRIRKEAFDLQVMMEAIRNADNPSLVAAQSPE